MGTLAWLLPTILSLIGTGVSAGVSVSNSNKQLDAQKEAQQMQERANNFAKTQQDAINQQNQRMNMTKTLDSFKNSLVNTSTGTGITNYNTVGAGNIQGLNSQQGYLTEEDETAYARCGGRFKKAFGGKNKVDSVSIYVSPNNIPVKTDSNIVIGYRDRLAQFKLGGRKC